MDWTKPIQVNGVERLSPDVRLLTLFGHLDCRAYRAGAFIEVGAGSLPVISRIIKPPHFQGSMGRIGRFVEAAACEILFGGEHANDQVMNAVFMGAPVFWGAAESAGIGVQVAGPIDIGNGVILSQGCRVLSGVKIGDGAVVAAGAVVTSDVEPFSIVGGVPARKIKDRFSPELREQIQAARWWDFAPDYIGERMADIQAAAMQSGRYAVSRPRFVIALDAPEGGRVLGFVVGDQEFPLKQAPETVRNYVQQAFAGDTAHWLADPWA